MSSADRDERGRRDRRDYEDRRGEHSDRRDYDDRRGDHGNRRDYEDRRTDRRDYDDRRDHDRRGDHGHRRDYDDKGDYDNRGDYDDRGEYDDRGDYSDRRGDNEGRGDYDGRRDYRDRRGDQDRDYYSSSRGPQYVRALIQCGSKADALMLCRSLQRNLASRHRAPFYAMFRPGWTRTMCASLMLCRTATNPLGDQLNKALEPCQAAFTKIRIMREGNTGRT